jgi:hypothetical protein
VHHWVIEAPVDETSRGRCSRCGAERDFTNRYVEAQVRPSVGGRFAWPNADRPRRGTRRAATS